MAPSSTNGAVGDALDLVREHVSGGIDGAYDWAVANVNMPSGNRRGNGCGSGHANDNITSAITSNGGGTGRAERIVKQTEPLANTPGELYLRSRGIDTDRLPVSIRYRRNADGEYGAVAALVVRNGPDGPDDILAVHQVYVTADGRNAPVEVQKRTNKRDDAWSRWGVHFPRTNANNAIIIAEGLETTASIAQATGCECRAMLGIANIEKMPVRQGATVIIARDGDAPDSPASARIRDAVLALEQRGARALIAEPPLGTDANDLLVEQGHSTAFAILRPDPAIRGQGQLSPASNRGVRSRDWLARFRAPCTGGKGAARCVNRPDCLRGQEKT